MGIKPGLGFYFNAFSSREPAPLRSKTLCRLRHHSNTLSAFADVIGVTPFAILVCHINGPIHGDDA